MRVSKKCKRSQTNTLKKKKSVLTALGQSKERVTAVATNYALVATQNNIENVLLTKKSNVYTYCFVIVKIEGTVP